MDLKYLKNWLCKCFRRNKKHSPRFLDPKDTHNAFWWATLNAKLAFVHLKENSTGHVLIRGFRKCVILSQEQVTIWWCVREVVNQRSVIPAYWECAQQLVKVLNTSGNRRQVVWCQSLTDNCQCFRLMSVTSIRLTAYPGCCYRCVSRYLSLAVAF